MGDERPIPGFLWERKRDRVEVRIERNQCGVVRFVETATLIVWERPIDVFLRNYRVKKGAARG